MTPDSNTEAPAIPLPDELPANHRAQLLVVDDQPVNIRLMHKIFSDDHDVFMAASGEQALAFCRRTPPDLVLLDVVMPDISGLEVCRALKQSPDTAAIPVIFVTALNNADEEVACWDAGAVDFITKPINAQTTRNRVRAHLMLKYQSDILRRLAWIDGLTGVANRRQFDERLQREWKRCRRDSMPLAAAVIDIDYFKAFNDTYGHLAGDDCLRRVAQAAESALQRPADFIARTGGEEFTCVLPDTDAAGAMQIAERVAARIRALEIPHVRSATAHVTVSIGIATTSGPSDHSMQEWLNRADTALYAAKHRGRAQVVADDGG